MQFKLCDKRHEQSIEQHIVLYRLLANFCKAEERQGDKRCEPIGNTEKSTGMAEMTLKESKVKAATTREG